MPTLLSVLASPRGDYSVSTALVAKFAEAWQKNHNGSVITRDLFKTELPFVDVPWIMGAYTPAETHSPEIAKAIAVSDNLIAELESVDHIVIGAPMYNFSLPAILKAYIDHVVRIGKTVSPSYEGQLKGKKATVIIASGGVYTPGAYAENYNVESAYLKQILGFIGITDVTIILAGGTSALNSGEKTLEALVAEYTPEVVAAAS